MIIKQSELQYLIKESIKKALLNEISIKDKYQKERDRLNMSFDTFEQLCNLDPTTKQNKVGKYANWIITKYNPNADLRSLQRCLEWYCDGVKRGILKRYNIPLDINQYKSYDEFMTAMNNLSNNNDTSMSQSEYNNRQKLEGQFDVLGSTSFYDIVAPKSYAAERYFGSNTEWCTVANERFFDSYSKEGQLYIIYPKNGDSEYKMQFHFEDKQFADKYDEVYEKPMECIEKVVDDEGVKQNLVILCKKVFSQYKGLFMNFNERIEDAKQRLLNGESPERIFEDAYDFSEGYAAVLLNSKWNFINTKGEILSDEWFEDAYDFSEGYAAVKLNYKYNFINKDGKIISDKWFDNVVDFKNGYANVYLNNKWNFINKNGEILSDDWFDSVDDFKDGCAEVKLNGKYNFINTDGEFLSDTWFDSASDFYNGFALIKLNGKYNFINTNGEFLSDTCFDEYKSGYYYGCNDSVFVFLNGEKYEINKNGELYDGNGELIQADIRNGIKINKNKKNDIMKLTENQLKKIIRESIDNVLGGEKMLLQYHVKNNGRFEVRELTHECDPNKTTQENLNDAYEKALKMGLVNDKQIRWKMIR